MIDIAVQNAAGSSQVPGEEDFRLWVKTALADCTGDAAVTIRLVGEPEGRELNLRYRKKDYATNVLSFPAEIPEMLDLPDLGDIVMCVPVVVREAAEQEKNEKDHWAHLVIHAILHLRGFDHEEPEQAQEMESIEIDFLNRLEISNPY